MPRRRARGAAVALSLAAAVVVVVGANRQYIDTSGTFPGAGWRGELPAQQADPQQQQLLQQQMLQQQMMHAQQQAQQQGLQYPAGQQQQQQMMHLQQQQYQDAHLQQQYQQHLQQQQQRYQDPQYQDQHLQQQYQQQMHQQYQQQQPRQPFLDQFDNVAVAVSDQGKEHWRGAMVQISWRPRVYVLRNFLTPQECDHLIQQSLPKLTKSAVVDSDTGAWFDSNVRTSSGTFFGRGEDDVISGIERRIALVAQLPEDHGEGLQVLRYQDGQKYEPHHDYFYDPVNARPENGGQRIVTVLMYLSNTESGGETVFPHAERKVAGPGWSDCALNGLSFKPVRGDAVLFYSLHPDGREDPNSLHGGCPVIRGEKFVATKWIHVGPFGSSMDEQKAAWGDCVDADEQCTGWAAMGECDGNAAYMHNYCRKACGVCQAAPQA